MDIRKLQRVIVDGLEDVKAQNILVFNTEHLSALFERVIIASGTSNRQTKSLASSVREAVKGGGFPAIEGWYGTNAGPHLTESPEAASFVKTFQEKYHATPDDYSITAYDAVLVVIDAIERVAQSGKTVDRNTIRDAIADAKVKTLQGDISFDDNGDVKQKVVAVFQVKHDTAHPVDDLIHQYKYVGVAPQA